MKRIRASIVVILAIFASLALTACSSNSSSSTEFEKVTMIGDHLCEVTFDTYVDDIDAARAYYESNYSGDQSGCSSIYKDGMLMRNLDWYLKYGGLDICELVVRTTANEGRYATIGVSFNPIVTVDTYDSLTDEQLTLLPFKLTDGMNSEGLMFSQNVVPEIDGVSNTSGTNPDGEDLCSYMLGRQILDYCANVDEAIEFLQNSNIFMMDMGNGYRMEGHFLIADKNRAVVIEFVDNQLVVLEQDDLPYDQSFITNHYVYNGDTDSGHGMGYERDKIIEAGYDSIVDWQSAIDMLESLKYSQIYTLPFGDEFWYSEYYCIVEIDGKVYDYNASTPKDDPSFIGGIKEQQLAYTNGDDDTWHTAHSSVYDTDDMSLHICIHENFDSVYDFKLGE